MTILIGFAGAQAIANELPADLFVTKASIEQTFSNGDGNSLREINLPLSPYSPNTNSPISELASNRNEISSVWQGQGEMQERGFLILSKGFDTCHTILVRDPHSQRFALLHYWNEFSPQQKAILNAFPKASTIALFGNQQSIAFSANQNELRLMGFENIHALKIEERGRWNFALDTLNNSVIYENIDKGHFIQIESFFNQ